MRQQILGLAVVASVALVGACGGGTSGNTFPNAGSTGAAGTTSAAGTTGAAGTTSAAGTTGAAGAAAGTTGAAGSAAGSTGTAGADCGSTGAAGAAAGSTGAAGTGTAGAGAGGTGGVVGGGDITKVAPTTGCGMAPPADLTPGQLIKQTIVTSGTKTATCADKKCGPWGPWTREYFVRLPAGYDKTKAYPVVIEGPGCGGKGNNLYGFANTFLDTIIRIGVSPSADASSIHATNPNQGCFDDKDGDNSVDWPMYEGMWDKLASTVCFDKNRVFAGGNSSGAWFSNELGCRYAGDAKHPIRGIMPNTGGLPDQPMYKPTCTTAPLAGFWSHGTGDTTNPFTGNIYAMNRILPLDSCTPAGVTYQTAAFTPFAVSATDSASCKKYTGCNPLYPMVVCPLNLNDHSGHEFVVLPGWPAFLKVFTTAPLLTQ